MSKTRMRFFPLFGIVCCMFGVLFFPNLTRHSLSASLKRSVGQLIPTLFPLMVLSKRLLSALSGIFASRSARKARFLHVISRITAIPEPILPLFFVGMFCGYPLPAVLTAARLREKALSTPQAETAVAICNNASPAFLIGFLGNGVYGSVKLGIFLYLSQLLALIGTAHIWAKSDDHVFSRPQACSFPAATLIEDIRSSVYTMLEIVGFTAFFSLIADLIGAVLTQLSVPPLVCAAVLSFLELTDGTAALSAASASVRTLLLPFFAGLGGLSVLFQIRAVLPDTVSVRRWIAARCCVAPLMTLCFRIMLGISGR